MTKTHKRFATRTIHGQTVQVEICPPGEARGSRPGRQAFAQTHAEINAARRQSLDGFHVDRNAIAPRKPVGKSQ